MTQELYDAISKDIKQALIQFLAVRGHGKSSSLRTMINEVKKRHPAIIWKIFDVSQAWYHCAPVKYRQVIAPHTVNRSENVGDCVYEMGFLTEAQRRMFVATVVMQDYKQRQVLKMADPEAFKDVPWVIYVFEEADVYFGSYSFRKNDWATPVLSDFVSVGRNYNMGAFLVATAEVGEIATKLRRRSSRIYGRVEAQGDLARIKRKNREVHEIVKSMPRFSFLYYGEKPVGPYRIPDLVDHIPENYIIVPVSEDRRRSGHESLSWLAQAVLGGVIGSALAVLIYFIFFR